jgi:hypothetical protein
VNLREDMPKEVSKVFARYPLDPRGGDLDPPRPPRPLGYFGLPKVNPSRPPLPFNRPYRQPLNYLEYVKDFDQNVRVKVFKAAIRANYEIDDAKIVNMFNLTFKDTMSN